MVLSSRLVRFALLPAATASAFWAVHSFGTTLEDSRAEAVFTYVASPAARETRVTLRRQGDRIVIIDDVTHAVVASGRADRIKQVVVRGVDGDHNDTLTVDFSGGLSLPGGIDFDGGIGGFDTLRIVGEQIANSLHTPTNRSDGAVELGGTEIRYRNLEPIVDTGTASSLIFNLPPGASDVSLQDGGSGMAELSSSFFESTAFLNKGSLTINETGSDTLTIASNVWADLTGVPVTIAGSGGNNNLIVDLTGATNPILPVTNSSGTLSGTWTLGNQWTVTFSGIQYLNPADLSVSSSGPASVTAGTSGTDIAYTIVVSNNGSNTAAGLTLSDLLPAGTTFVSVSQTAGPAVSCTTPAIGAGGTVSCSIAWFAAGASATFSVTVHTGTGPYSLTNTATLSSATTDPNPANNSSSVSTQVISTPVIAVIGPSNSTYGQVVTFTATAASGTAPVTVGTLTITDITTGTVLLAATSPNTSGQVSVSVNNLSSGSHTIQASYAPGVGFTSSSGSATITVNKAVLTVAANNATKIYGAVLPTLTYTTTGFVNGDTSAVVSGAAALSTTATAASPAGSYPITVNVAGLSAVNYTFTSGNGTLAITQAPLTVAVNSATKSYGAALPTFTDNVTGLVNGDTVGSAITVSLSTTATAASAVGAYPITAAVSGPALGNYSLINTPGVLTITPVPLTVTANNASKVYGAALPTFTENVTGLINGDTVGSAITVGLSTTATAASAVGAYPITAAVSGPASGNYSLINTLGILTITPAPLTVTANNAAKIYGAPLPAFTFTLTGFVNGDTAAAASGTPSLTTTATAASPVATYAIVPSLGTLAASNYSFTFANGTLTITKANTSTTLTTPGGMLVATVTAVPPGAGTPTGTVQFLNGSIVLGTVPLAGSTAMLSQSVGSITAVYSGDGNLNGSTSGVATIYSPGTSSVSLTSSVNPSKLGQAVTFTALVGTSGGAPSAGAPAGAVQFFDGTKLLGTGNVSGGQASYTTSSLTGGSHAVFAQYSGDSTWPSASATYVQVVNAPVTMSVSAAPTVPVYGQSVVLTADLSATTVPAGFTPPAGQVTFYLEGSTPFAPETPLGAAMLASGSGIVSVNNLPAATNYIQARYSGDATWPSFSRLIAVTVSPASTSTSVSLAIISGQLTVTGAVATVAPGGGTPTGSVLFVDASNNVVIGSGSLSSGKTSATIGAKAASTVLGRPIQAVYGGDGNFKGSTSAPLPAVVSAAANLSASIAPDEIASLFGIAGLNGDTPATLPLTTSVGGVTVNVTDSDGTARPAELYGVFASSGQINFMIPGASAPGLAVLTVTLPGGGTVATVITIANVSPGVFTANMTGEGVYAGQVVYGYADGTQTMANAAVWNSSSNRFEPNPLNLGTPSDQVYLVLYGTGIRHAGSVTARVHGVSVPVSYFGAQGSYAGLDQINLGPLPASLAGSGVVDLVITADGQVGNTVTVDFQ
jgi:uncharacterized repeat protein (TIGR01451 family)